MEASGALAEASDMAGSAITGARRDRWREWLEFVMDRTGVC